MEHKLHTFKNDLYNVFVKGDASNIQMARVFIVIAVPLMTLFMIGAHIVK